MFTRHLIGLAGSGLALTLVTAALVPASTAATAVRGAVAPGSSAQCPAAFPASELTPGTEVTGLTTAGTYTRGSGASKNVHHSPETPEGFTGTYLSTLEDPTGDLFLIELEGSRITQPDGSIDAGIWAGISGSPVYANDGRLIGSVSYGFTGIQGSRYAGVTPAADLYSLLDEVEAPAAKETVKLGAAEQAEAVRAGLPAKVAASGLRRLDVPTLVSGLNGVPKEGLERIARRAGLAAPVLAGAGATQSREIPIVAGGNVAVSEAYGSIASYSVGTAAAVCGDVVIGYGHLGSWTESTSTLHGASTSVIMADGGWSHKIANLGAPAGTLLNDRFFGITGRLGQAPAGALATVTTQGPTKSGTTETRITNERALSWAVASQTYRDALLSADQDTYGSVDATWNITYRRANGTQQTFSRSDRFDGLFFSEELAGAVATDIETILDQEFEEVTITSVKVNQTVSRANQELKVKKIEAVQPGGWKDVTGKTAKIKAGKTLRVRVSLVPADRRSKAKPTSKIVKLAVPKKAKKGRTELTAVGNSSGYFDDEEVPFFEGFEVEEKEPTTFDQLIAQMRKQRPNNTVDVELPLDLKDGRTITRKAWFTVDSAVQGFEAVTVKVEQPKKKTKKKAKKSAKKKAKKS